MITDDLVLTLVGARTSRYHHWNPNPPFVERIGSEGDLVVDLVDRGSVRVSRVTKRGRRRTSAWGQLHHERDREKRPALARQLLEDTVSRLQADDPTSDLLEFLLGLGLRRGRSTVWFRRDFDGTLTRARSPYRDAWPGMPMDHLEVWSRGRLPMVRVGHNYDMDYRAQAKEELANIPRDVSWRQAPIGCSWYYPGRTTALLNWHDDIDADLRPFLDQRFGVEPALVLADAHRDTLLEFGRWVDETAGALTQTARNHAIYNLCYRETDPLRQRLKAAYRADPSTGDAHLRRLAAHRGWAKYAEDLRNGLRGHPARGRW